jgi:hypothetical protein
MALRPLGDNFLFAFLDDNSEGRFIDRSRAGIIMTNQNILGQSGVPRWGKVLAIGNDVIDFKLGDYVLIEAGMWTIGFKHDGVKIWKSDQQKVCAITEDYSATYNF